MAVPKKRTSRSKKHIRKNIWKKKADRAALRAHSIAKTFNYCGGSILDIRINTKMYIFRNYKMLVEYEGCYKERLDQYDKILNPK